jgi:hypothetical protein
MSSRDRGWRRRGGQQRHHLVLGDRRRQRLADKDIRVGQRTFRRVGCDNLAEHEI